MEFKKKYGILVTNLENFDLYGKIRKITTKRVTKKYGIQEKNGILVTNVLIK